MSAAPGVPVHDVRQVLVAGRACCQGLSLLWARVGRWLKGVVPGEQPLLFVPSVHLSPYGLFAASLGRRKPSDWRDL